MDGMFKEKEEVQEYLKNLGIEYRYSCYSEKNPEGCQLLGDFFSQITQEYEKSNKVFKKNCDDNQFGRSCSSYAMHTLYGKGCEKNPKEALDYFSKACELDDSAGCDFAGKMLAGIDKTVIKGFELDPEKGLKYLEKGCFHNNSSTMFESSESCYASAFLNAKPINGLKQNIPRAIELAKKGCELGNMNSCGLAATYLEREGQIEESKIYKKAYDAQHRQLKENVQIEMQRT